MTKRSIIQCLCIFVLALTTSGISMAAVTVTSPLFIGSAGLGWVIDIPIHVASAQAVSGINGELTFERKYFSNPQISVVGNTFIGLGNEVQNDPSAADYDAVTGHLRFVIYPNTDVNPNLIPTMNLGNPVIIFHFQVAKTINHSAISLMHFVLPNTTDPTVNVALSDPLGNSLSGAFSDIQLTLNSTSAKKDWSLYE